MKGRLSSTIWSVVLANLAALLIVLGLAYNAGAKSGGVGLVDAFGSAGGPLLIGAVVLGLIAFAYSVSQLGHVGGPGGDVELFAEKIAAGQFDSRLENSSALAESLNRVAERLQRSTRDQAAQESLQRSVTEFLTIVSQIARGDLTLRGKVTNDALGNVVDSVNYMLDNFTKVLERVRKAAIDVQANASDILISSEEMASRRHAAGPGNHQHFVRRGRAHGLDEAGVQQRGSQRRSRAPRTRRRRTRQPRRARHAGRHAAHPFVRAGHREEDQVAGRSLTGNFRNHQRHQRHYRADQPAGSECRYRSCARR